jgi:N-acetylornithine carbamoyltransferase
MTSITSPATAGLYNRDFLLTWDHPSETIELILRTARALERHWRTGVSSRVFDTGLAVSIFRDKSTRTRYSFRSACNMLGLTVEDLDESTSQIAHGETVRETAAMVGFHTEVIGIRDDIYLGEGHAYMREVAASLADAHAAGVLAQRPAVVNLQCDLDHPTQTLADLSHLVSVFGSLDALRGRKLAMTWAYSPSYGKPMSVPQGVIGLMSRFGMEVVLAHPPGYELVDDAINAAAAFADQSGGSFRVAESMSDAFAGADIVYPKSWAPQAIMRQRTAMRRSGDVRGLAELEREALANNARFKSWECDESLMAKTRDGRALYMHCLPADVTGVSCAAGEVSRAVFERARLDTYREASWKPFVIAALVLATRFANPDAVLETILMRRAPRVWTKA